MRHVLAVLALALASSAAPAAAAPPAGDRAFVYLGQLGAGGSVEPAKFTGLPRLKVSAEQTVDVPLAKLHAIVAVEGMRLRTAASPTAPTAGRLPRGARVKLLSVHASFGFLWGEVDTAGAKVLALEAKGPARDGFTGRSGYGPSRGGHRASAHRSRG